VNVGFSEEFVTFFTDCIEAGKFRPVKHAHAAQLYETPLLQYVGTFIHGNGKGKETDEESEKRHQ